MVSYRRIFTPGDHDWLGHSPGHSLRHNHLNYAGFARPGRGEAVYRTKRPIPIGQGQRAIVASCVCLVHLTPSVKGEENLAPDAGAMERLRWLPGEGRSSP